MANSQTLHGQAAVVGVILAGGLSRRLGGGDKALLRVGGRPLLAYVVARVERQVQTLIINANGDAARFADFGLPVVADPITGSVGPLGGILAGLRWTRQNTDARWIFTAPCDTPFLPHHLVERLLGSLEGGAEIAVARSRQRLHPTVALWPVAAADDLGRWLLEGKPRAVHAWLETRSSTAVDFDDEGQLDPFFNVNTPADVAMAERHIEEHA